MVDMLDSRRRVHWCGNSLSPNPVVTPITNHIVCMIPMNLVMAAIHLNRDEFVKSKFTLHLIVGTFHKHTATSETLTLHFVMST